MTYIIITILVLCIFWPVREKKQSTNFRCEIRTENESGVFWKFGAEFGDPESAKRFCIAASKGSGCLCRVIDKKTGEVTFVS